MHSFSALASPIIDGLTDFASGLTDFFGLTVIFGGLYKIKRLFLCIFTARPQARYSRINSIFNVVLSVWPLFCFVWHSMAFLVSLYGFIYLALYGVLRALYASACFAACLSLMQLDRACALLNSVY